MIIGESPNVIEQRQLSCRSIGLSARSLEPAKEPQIDDRPLKIKRIKPIIAAPCSLQVVSECSIIPPLKRKKPACTFQSLSRIEILPEINTPLNAKKTSEEYVAYLTHKACEEELANTESATAMDPPDRIQAFIEDETDQPPHDVTVEHNRCESPLLIVEPVQRSN